MENASKALLIAAAVLVATIIITIGIKVYTSSSETGKVAMDTGKTISDKTGEATDLAISSITGKDATASWLQDKTTIKNSKTGQNLEVGDIVNYDCGVSSYTGKWGLLGVENGSLLLMSTSNVGNVELRGKQDYLTDGTKKLNNICKPYLNNNYANSVRSVKVEDINNVIGFKVPGSTTHNYTLVNGYINWDNFQTNSQYFEDLDGRKLTEGNSISIKDTFFDYNLGEKISSSTKAFNLLSNNNKRYWIDSKYTRSDPDYATWGFYCMGCSWNNYMGSMTLWNSWSGPDYLNQGVRAVIILKPNAKISSSSSSGWNLEI